MIEIKKYRKNKPFNNEFYEVEYYFNNDTCQGSGTEANKGFKWLRRSNGISGEAYLDYHML